jgi:hypothetical protein
VPRINLVYPVFVLYKKMLPLEFPAFPLAVGLPTTT